MPTDILEYIRDISQSHPSINSKYARYKICDCIKQRQVEWKGVLLSMQKWEKFHKKNQSVGNELS